MDQLISVFSEIFKQYSIYTGTGIFMVMFLVALVYMGLTDNNHGNRTVIMYGSIGMIAVVLCPVFYYLYVNFIDSTTYWRMWWLVPAGVGLAYVGTKLVDAHRISGFILALGIMILGGRLVYTSSSDYVIAQNDYQIPQWAVMVCDQLEAQDEEYLKVAFPTEFLSYVRQYDANINMPFGREQLDPAWGLPSGFFEEMNKESYDFHVLAMKAGDTQTNYIVVNNLKPYDTTPEEFGFELRSTVGVYEIYRYTKLP